MKITQWFNAKVTDYGNVQEVHLLAREFPRNIYLMSKYDDVKPKRVVKRMHDIVSLHGKNIKIPNQNYDPYLESLNKKRSFRRSMCSFFGYAYSNDWKYFATFTFDRLMIDRYSYAACYDAINAWLKATRKDFPKVKMLAVSEFHKDGALHFHALLGGIEFTEHDTMPYYQWSIKQQQVVKCTKICTFHMGNSDVKEIKDSEGNSDGAVKLVNYCSKYIVKQSDVQTRRYHRFGDMATSTVSYTTYSDVVPFLDYLLQLNGCYFKTLKDGSTIIRATTWLNQEMIDGPSRLIEMSKQKAPLLVKGDIIGTQLAFVC